MLEMFTHYYGLDWLDAAASTAGIYLLSQKQRLGFLLNAVGAVSGLTLFLLLESYPFIALNAVFIYLNLRGYQRWATASSS